MNMVRITNAILGNENLILPVSSYDKNNNVFIGGPTILNNTGVDKRIFIKLSPDETIKLQNSIDTIKNAIISIEIENSEDNKLKEEEIDII